MRIYMFKMDGRVSGKETMTKELFKYVLLPAHQRRIMAGCKECRPDPDPGIGPPPPEAFTGTSQISLG